ncbi:MAG: hypothetical protein CL840_09100 [Crocinitomicaceae bacterium]|nr:hypothetical protein [Crocinitomicaceae bacterium]|tara:strand:+ start:11589 stop:12014 length:426 start_codon:yes stop_codon:yes gene_type:complete
MMNKIYIVVVFLLLIGCKEELTEKPVKMFPNGTVEEKHFLDTEGTVKKTIQYYKNGNIKIEGEFNDDGKREGMWKSYYENGQPWSIGEYQNGKQHGINRVYFPNGSVRYEGNWENDLKTGTWNFYDEKGGLVKSEDNSMSK